MITSLYREMIPLPGIPGEAMNNIERANGAHLSGAGAVYIGWATKKDAGAMLTQYDGDPADVLRHATELAVSAAVFVDEVE